MPSHRTNSSSSVARTTSYLSGCFLKEDVAPAALPCALGSTHPHREGKNKIRLLFVLATNHDTCSDNSALLTRCSCLLRRLLVNLVR